MATFPQPATLLVDLDAFNFRRLVNCLQKDDAWKIAAEFLRIFDQNKISSLSATVCPAESLLNELITRLCTIENLSGILRECSLYEAFLLISEPEQMEIIRQPTTSLGEDNEKLNIQIGSILKLEFEVIGVPPPKFQWFKDNEILVNQVESVLRYEQFSVDMEGEYYCCATQEINNLLPSNTVNSDAIKVEALPLACTVIEKPEEYIYLCEGSQILLKVLIFGHPKPKYEWLHENLVLEDETKNVLFIKRATRNHGGRYRCFVSNMISSVEIITNVAIYEQNASVIHKAPVCSKVALLIANDTYENLNHLTTPSNDVCTIAEILQTFGFKIICLQNLNLEEMEIAIAVFAETIQKGSFAFFYYAGHGFEMVDKFLLPTDSPGAENFKKIDALAESRILQKVLDKQPVLFVFLLDMCLKLPDRSRNPMIYEETFTPYVFVSNRNLIRGYSTTTNLSSFEMEGDANGIYVNSLKRYLTKNLAILTILSKVNAEVLKALKVPEQMPSIYYNTAEDFYLDISVQGFGIEQHHIYSALNIEEEKTHINGATVTLCRHKRSQNLINIIIANAETLDYSDNSSNMIIEEIEDGPHIILQIPLQRLEKTHFYFKLKINNTDFFISKQFQITNLFYNFKSKNT